MIGEIIEKAVIRGEVLSNEERNALLEFFARVERADTDVNRDVSASMSALFPRLSDISAIMGTVVAGEFRSGNFKTPGDGFTGGRFGWPGFSYGGTEYFLAGVSNDVLQVGLALADGTIKAGAGDVTIDGDGIWVTNQQAAFGFEDTNGDRFNLYIYSDGDDSIGIINSLTGKAILFSIKLTNATTPYMKWYQDPNNANVCLLQVNADNTAAQVAIGGPGQGFSNGILLSANKDGLETVFNDTSYDIDFRVESATNANFFKIDAGAETLAIGGDTTLDGAVEINTSNAAKNFTVHGDTQDGVFVVNGTLNQVEIGTTAEAVHIIDPNTGGAVIFNEPGNDVDFDIYDAGGTLIFHVDAAAAEITTNSDFIVSGNLRLSLGSNYLIGTVDISTGWLAVLDTWTRTGNHTFTITGDVTAKYRKGTKVRYKDGGSYEYGVIASVSFAGVTTTVTLITNTDYAMAAATITDNHISYIENPEGFPHYFDWDAAPAGFSAVPTGQTYRWHVKGKTIFCEYVELTNGTSNATTFTATGPVTPLQGVTAVGGTLVDNGALRTVAGRVTMGAGSTAIAFRTDMANGAWTNANGKRAVCYWSYEF
jgi:hypothetical protein